MSCRKRKLRSYTIQKEKQEDNMTEFKVDEIENLAFNQIKKMTMRTWRGIL